MCYLKTSGLFDKEHETEDEIYCKWNQLGFLEGLDENISVKTAIKLNDIAHYLLINNVTDDLEINGMLVVTRRVMTKLYDIDFKPEELYRFYIDNFARLEKGVRNNAITNSMCECFVYCEIYAALSDEFVEKLLKKKK